MKTQQIKYYLFLVLLFISWPIQALSPIGEWLTLDDKTEEKRGVIRLWLKDQRLFGSVEKIYPKFADSKICDKCPGEFKDKVIEGLTIIWGLTYQKNGEWSKGRVLDPERGKIYNIKMKLSPDGQTLKVRGYIGFSLFGRNQTWYRIN